MAISKEASYREFWLVGDVHVVEELAGSPFEGKSVKVRVSSNVNIDWLSKIDKELITDCAIGLVENCAIGLVEIREGLRDKEYDFDGEIVVEGPILLDACISLDSCNDLWLFLNRSKSANRLTYLDQTIAGTRIPPPGRLSEYAPLNDIPYDKTNFHSLVSMEAHCVE